MRHLFLDKPPSRFTTRQWLVIAGLLALAEVVGFTIYVMRPADRGLAIGLADPQHQCMARGSAQFEVRREWPTTSDGRDARTLIASRCTLDPGSFR